MKEIKERVKSLLITDRLSGREELPHVLKSECYDLLSDFFELDEGKLSVSIDGDDDGFVITVKARALRVY